MLKYIDAHCHILSDAQMRDATTHGVLRFIVNATQPADWDNIIELATRDNVYGAIGVHPWYVSELRDGWDSELINALATHNGLMIGEIGLDKNHSDFELQQSAFCRQLQIAHDMQRAVHIHCVGAWGKCMDILRAVNLPPVMVFHAFSGAPELVPELVEMGAYFSFGASVCDKNHLRSRAAASAVPVSRVLVESDMVSPDVIPNIVAEIAHIRGVDLEQMAEIIYNNTMGLLNDRKI